MFAIQESIRPSADLRNHYNEISSLFLQALRELLVEATPVNEHLPRDLLSQDLPTNTNHASRDIRKQALYLVLYEPLQS